MSLLLLNYGDYDIEISMSVDSTSNMATKYNGILYHNHVIMETFKEYTSLTELLIIIAMYGRDTLGIDERLVYKGEHPY